MRLDDMPRGLPRPICPERNLPAPWNTDYDGDVFRMGTLNHERDEEGERKRLCQVCGLKLGESAVFVIDHKSLSVVDSSGLHERCGRLAFSHCPVLNGECPYDGDFLAVVGPVETLMELPGERKRRQAIIAALPRWDRQPNLTPVRPR